MKPEEEFNKWFKEEYPGPFTMNEGGGWYAMRRCWIEAFRLGHHQGMTRAAEIATKIGDQYNEQSDYAGGAEAASSQIAETILTERDRSEK